MQNVSVQNIIIKWYTSTFLHKYILVMIQYNLCVGRNRLEIIVKNSHNIGALPSHIVVLFPVFFCVTIFY